MWMKLAKDTNTVVSCETNHCGKSPLKPLSATYIFECYNALQWECPSFRQQEINAVFSAFVIHRNCCSLAVKKVSLGCHVLTELVLVLQRLAARLMISDCFRYGTMGQATFIIYQIPVDVDVLASHWLNVLSSEPRKALCPTWICALKLHSYNQTTFPVHNRL